MIMNAEPDKINVMFITTEDSIAIDTGPKEGAFYHFKEVCDISMVEMVRVGHQNAYMLMDEEAHLHENPRPINKLATSLLNACCLEES